MRGVPLTPIEVEALWRAFEETGNAAEAARRVGCSEQAARQRIASIKDGVRWRLHAHACKRGVRKGRKALDRSVSLLDKVLQSEDAAGLSIEPRDLASLIRAQASAVSELRALDAHVNQRLQWRVTRAKTTAEIEVLRMEIAKLQREASPEGDRKSVEVPAILATPREEPDADASS